MADGADKTDLYGLMFKINERLSHMEGLMKGLADYQEVIKAVVDERDRIHSEVDRKIETAEKLIDAQTDTKISDAESRMVTLVEERVARLEKALADRESRDERTAQSVRLQFIGLGVIATAGVSYAIFNLLTGGPT